MHGNPSCPCRTQFQLKLKLASFGEPRYEAFEALHVPTMVEFCLKVGPQRSRLLFSLNITLRQFLRLCLEFFLHALASHSLSSSLSSQLWAKIKELMPLKCALRW